MVRAERRGEDVHGAGRRAPGGEDRVRGLLLVRDGEAEVGAGVRRQRGEAQLPCRGGDLWERAARGEAELAEAALHDLERLRCAGVEARILEKRARAVVQLDAELREPGVQLLPARPADQQLQRGAPARRARLVAGAGSADGRHRPASRAVFVAVITRPSACPAPSAGTAVDSHTTRLGGRKLFSGGSRAASTYGHVKRVHSTRRNSTCRVEVADARLARASPGCSTAIEWPSRGSSMSIESPRSPAATSERSGSAEPTALPRRREAGRRGRSRAPTRTSAGAQESMTTAITAGSRR